MLICGLSLSGGAPSFDSEIIPLSNEAPPDLSGARRSKDGHNAEAGACGQRTAEEGAGWVSIQSLATNNPCHTQTSALPPEG